jgi:hypothetical protein
MTWIGPRRSSSALNSEFIEIQNLPHPLAKPQQHSRTQPIGAAAEGVESAESQHFAFDQHIRHERHDFVAMPQFHDHDVIDELVTLDAPNHPARSSYRTS